MARTRILVLFAQEWDRLALADPALVHRFEFIHRGFDLFRFPENARLLAFDIRSYVDRMVELGQRLGVEAVISPHEQFGILVAALVAQRLNLPGPEPEAILTAQHKYYARIAIGRVAPHAVPGFGAFPYTVHRPEQLPLPFPFFVKPVKATFSVLARRVANFPELRHHLHFKPFEQHIIKRLVKPFNDVLKAYPGYPIDAHHLVAEGLVEGMQVNVDGYACKGELRILGIVDEVMYPGTMAFNRFEYPSSLPEPVQHRAAELAKLAMRAVGFDHGMFNVELAWDPRQDTLRVIEINPRIASQFVSLYEWVHGIRLYDILLDLALGETPRCAPRATDHSHAASFIFRKFDGQPVHPVPGRHQVERVLARHPDAHLMLYIKHGTDLAREMKWLGSHRYAVLNLRGSDQAELYSRYRDVRDTLGFSAHSGPEPAPLWPGEYGLALHTSRSC